MMLKKQVEKYMLWQSPQIKTKDSYKCIFHLTVWILPFRFGVRSRRLSSRLNKLQERALRSVYNGSTSSFKELLEKRVSNSLSKRKCFLNVF